MTKTEQPDKREQPATAPAASAILAGYGMLRLKREIWREILGGLVTPLVRLHRWRNARTRLFRRAISVADCERTIQSLASACRAGHDLRACGPECRQ